MSEWIMGRDGVVHTSNGAFASVLEVWAHIGRQLEDRAAHELAAWFYDSAANGGLGCRGFSLDPLDERLASPERIVAFNAIVRELALLLTLENPPTGLDVTFMWKARLEWFVWMVELLRLISTVSAVPLPPPPEPSARDIEEVALERMRLSITTHRAGFVKFQDPQRVVVLLYQAIDLATRIDWPHKRSLRFELFDALEAAGRHAELPTAYRAAAAVETDPETKALWEQLAEAYATGVL